MVTVALRRHGHLDHVLAALLERGMPKKSGNFAAILRLALAQLLFMPETGAHSAVHLGVEAMRRDPRSRHLASLTNAVLRRAQARTAEFTGLDPQLLIPEWLRKRWAKAYGDAAIAAFAQALIEGAPLDITAKDPEAAAMALGADRLYGDTIRLSERDRPLAELAGFAEGGWWVQDAAAALPARLVNLPAGARVLDICAAPGGKTAQLIKAGYRVTALDADETRLERLKSNLDRLGYEAEIIAADALAFEPDERFDAVLLDAPCTATGTFRRHPELLWQKRPADISDRAALQRRLIAQAAKCLNPGGVLVYCVCSLEPEEGDAQREAAEAAGLVPMPITAGEGEWPAGALQADGTLRSHPGLIVGEKGGTLDGFHVARFRRG